MPGGGEGRATGFSALGAAPPHSCACTHARAARCARWTRSCWRWRARRSRRWQQRRNSRDRRGWVGRGGHRACSRRYVDLAPRKSMVHACRAGLSAPMHMHVQGHSLFSALPARSVCCAGSAAAAAASRRRGRRLASAAGGGQRVTHAFCRSLMSSPCCSSTQLAADVACLLPPFVMCTLLPACWTHLALFFSCSTLPNLSARV